MSILKMLFGGSSNSLNAAEAKARIEGSQPPYILDVRQPDEYRSGHLSNAKLVPLHELQNRLHELPKEREILCVCRSGSRSGMAVRQLTAAGYNAVNLRGGLMGWQRAGYPIKKGK